MLRCIADVVTSTATYVVLGDADKLPTLNYLHLRSDLRKITTANYY